MAAHPKNLSESQGWNTLVSIMEGQLRENFRWAPEEIMTGIETLVADFGGQTETVAKHCMAQLTDRSTPYEQQWSRIKAAAEVFHWATKSSVLGDTIFTQKAEIEEALWTAAEICGVESFATLNAGQSQMAPKWRHHKMALDSLWFALVNLNPADNRMEKFFNHPMTRYWKAFFITWDIVWHMVDLESYLSGRSNHLAQYFEILVYTLDAFDTEFTIHRDKPNTAWETLQNQAHLIPTGLKFRRTVYASAYRYLCSIHGESSPVKIFNLIYDVLGKDTLKFVVEDTHIDVSETGRVLLSMPSALEMSWDSERNTVLPSLQAAMDHTDGTVKKQAMRFLKKKAPDIVKLHMEGLIDKLDQVTDQTEVDDLIENLMESGSELAFQTILNKALTWIAANENSVMLERIARAIKKSPESIKYLVALLKRTSLDAHTQTLVWKRIIQSQNHMVVSKVFLNESGAAVKTTTEALKLLDALADHVRVSYVDELLTWCLGFEKVSKQYGALISNWRDHKKTANQTPSPKSVLELALSILDSLSASAFKEYQDDIRQWVTYLLSEISDQQNYEKDPDLFDKMTTSLKRFAIEPLGKQLPVEENINVREYIVRALGNTGGPVAVNSLVRATTSNEREREERKRLLADYYLQPSKERSEEAARLLQDAVANAKQTMKLLQLMNVASFIIGAILLLGGVAVAVVNEELGTRFVGALSGLGGLGAIVTIFMKDPLQRIQQSMGDLVQIQTAFTGFIWELNLNGTYIQSQYVADGILTDYDIKQTVSRIEDSIDKTMHLIQVYAEGEYDAGPPQLNYLLPPSGAVGSTIALFGSRLNGQQSPGRKNKYEIALNHQPMTVNVQSWTDHNVVFELTADMASKASGSKQLWISLLVDGKETNALPFQIQSA